MVLVIEGPNGAEIALEDGAKGLDIAFTRASREAKVTLKSGGREVTLENGKSLFGVAGQLRAFASPVRVVGDRTYVSPASAATVLGAARPRVLHIAHLQDLIRWTLLLVPGRLHRLTAIRSAFGRREDIGGGPRGRIERERAQEFVEGVH